MTELAASGGRPVCQEQETIDGSPSGPMLTCALPAGHRSEEHYDRAFALVWRPRGRDQADLTHGDPEGTWATDAVRVSGAVPAPALTAGTRSGG